jgi:alpha-amylase
MKPTIDNLIFIHEKIADGPTQQRWKDHDIFAYERMAGRHLLVGLNNNGIADHTITVDTGFGPNSALHDYTGHLGDVRTDGSGRATITIPRNTNGLGYVCYSRAGLVESFSPTGHDVTQVFEGAQDLDIPPADPARVVTVGRVFAASGTPIRAALRFDATGWTDATKITLELDGPDGATLASRDFVQADQNAMLVHNAGSTGHHAFKIRATATPAQNAKPSYKLSVTYRAPRAFNASP